MNPTNATNGPTAGQIMHTEVLTVSESTSLSDVQRLLCDYQISGAPVTDEAGHIIGVVSMRDLIDRYADDAPPRDRGVHDFYDMVRPGDGSDDDVVVPEDSEDTAADIMTAQVHSVALEAPLVEIARKMSELRVHRLLVEQGGKHVELVTSFDVLEALGAMN